MLSTCNVSKRRFSLIPIFLLNRLQPVSMLCVDPDFETGFDAMIRPRGYEAGTKRFRLERRTRETTGLIGEASVEIGESTRKLRDGAR